MLARIFNIMGLLCLLGAIISFFYYWDPSRIFFMSLKSKNDFAFEALPETLTTIKLPEKLGQASNEAREQTREALGRLLRGASFDPNSLPDKIETVFANGKALIKGDDCSNETPITRKTSCLLGLYEKLDNLEEVKQLSFNLPYDYVMTGFHFKPVKSNGKAIIYHHGYAGDFHENHVILKRLINRGYSLVALSMPLYGDNYYNSPKEWWNSVNGKWGDMETPLAVFVQPVAKSLSYLNTSEHIQDIAMIGISAGGWATAINAAIDSRISKSYPIAGVLPIALRQGDKERAAPQFYEPMINMASYLDMFILAATPENRSQLQIFNRYDRCCFNNVRGKLYEDTIQQQTPGDFKVLIDETHARHKISRWALDHILKDLEQ